MEVQEAINTPVDAVILAAGMSSRMGQPKQLLPLQGRPMLELTIRRVLQGNFANIYTVIGFAAEQIKESIKVDDARLQWIYNPDYQSGQGSSLRQGLLPVVQRQHAALIFLGDAPFVSLAAMQAICLAGIERCKQTEKPFLIQPQYQGVPGHPVFMGHLTTDMLALLHGDQGAKSLFPQLERISFPCDDYGITFDIDTPEAYQQAIRMQI